MPTTTTNMALTLSVPGVDPGPAWGTSLNSSLSLIDAHDHSSGKGVQIGSAGLNIQSPLSLNGFGLTSASGVQLVSRASLDTSTTGLLYCLNNNLIFESVAGTNTLLTSSGQVVSNTTTMTYAQNSISSNLAMVGTEPWAIGRVDTTAVRTITLPRASSYPGRFYVFEDATGQGAANPFVVQAGASDYLNGALAGTLLMSRTRGSLWAISDGTGWTIGQMFAGAYEVTGNTPLTLDPGVWPQFSAARVKTTSSPAGAMWKGTLSGTTSLAIVSSSFVVQTTTGGNVFVAEIPGLHNGATLTSLAVYFSAGTGWTTVPTAFPVITVYGATVGSATGVSGGSTTYPSETLATWNNGTVKQVAVSPSLGVLNTGANGYFMTFQGPTGGAGTTTCNALHISAFYSYSSMATSW